MSQRVYSSPCTTDIKLRPVPAAIRQSSAETVLVTFT